MWQVIITALILAVVAISVVRRIVKHFKYSRTKGCERCGNCPFCSGGGNNKEYKMKK